MDKKELEAIFAVGEDSKHQFKRNIDNPETLAAEMIAFSNGSGGKIFVGVNDDGSVPGLTAADVRRINQMLSNAASQIVRPAINPEVENVHYDSGIVMVISVSRGINKPYMDKDGVCWVKSGADKRRATSREELQRMFQSSNLLHGDEVPVPQMPLEKLSLPYFRYAYRRLRGEDFPASSIPLEQLLQNMNLMSNGCLNVAGALLFGEDVEYKLPAFVVKAVSFYTDDITSNNYTDSRDIAGRLEDVFRQCMNFILTNIHLVQGGQSVNSVGLPEIPIEVFEELIVNAVLHRDYFISAPIKLFILRTRIEIISPGHLPNNLTVENIKFGNSNLRNPILASYATKLIPYHGIGSGIRRALNFYKDIEFFDNREANNFTVIIKRPKIM